MFISFLSLNSNEIFLFLYTNKYYIITHEWNYTMKLYFKFSINILFVELQSMLDRHKQYSNYYNIINKMYLYNNKGKIILMKISWKIKIII